MSVSRLADLGRNIAFILYILRYISIEEARGMMNDVSQGLSFSIVSLHMRKVEKFLAANGQIVVLLI